MTQRYIWKNIRALLTEQFSTEELLEFCYNEPDFRVHYNQLVDMGKAEVIDRLIEHVEQTSQLEKLLTWAKEKTPINFKEYQPYSSDYEEPPSLPTADRYNLKNIRTLLVEGFSEEELRRFCHDEFLFRPVYDWLTPDMGKLEVIDQLVEYADRQLLIEPLLAWVRLNNPARYEHHQPYTGNYDYLPPIPVVKRPNLENIRALLIEAFTEEELRHFCYDVPYFRPVHNQLGQHTSKVEIIHYIVEYADQKERTEQLLDWAEKHNYSKYEAHKPYEVFLPVPANRSYNLKIIRALLDEGFTAKELRRFCYDEPDFRPVYDQLAQDTPKPEIIDRLIGYAENVSKMEILLAWTQAENPIKYEKYLFYSYYGINTSPDLSNRVQVLKLNPYIAGDPIDNPELFFGREELIATILRSLPGNHIAVEGPRRSGKSSLLNEIARRLRQLDDPEFCFVPVKFNCQSATQTEFFYKLMRALLKTLKEMYPTLAWPPLIHQQRAETYSDIDFEDDLHILLATLRAEVKKEIKIILLLDEGDTLNQYDLATQGKIRTLISDNKTLKMVWVGTNITQAAKDLGSPWYNLQITYPLSPLPPDEARRLIIEPAKRLGYTYQAEATERILAYSNGQPYIIQYLCHRAVEAMLVDERAVIALADVETAIGQLEAEKSAQDTASVVYQSRTQAEEQFTLAETPAPYETDPEDDSP